SMARTLEAEGIRVALLVYIDAQTFVNNFHHRLGNVCRVVNIVSSSWCLRGRRLDEAEANHKVDGVWHLEAPRHDATLEVLACELAKVAATVPHDGPPVIVPEVKRFENQPSATASLPEGQAQPVPPEEGENHPTWVVW